MKLSNERIGELQTSEYKYSSGREEVIVDFAKGILWLLLIKQSEHEKDWEDCFETGREKREIIVFKIEADGWPKRECQEESVGLEPEVASIAEAVDDVRGHSYNSSLVLPWSIGVPVLRSFT